MKRVLVVTGVLLSGMLGAQAAPLKAQHSVASSQAKQACVARQRAAIAPYYAHGGDALIPGGLPPIVRNVIDEAMHDMATRCLPRSRRPLDWTDFLPPS